MRELCVLSGHTKPIMYNIKINPASTFVYAEFYGDLTAIEIKEMLMEIEHHKEVPRHLKLITDYRQVIDVDYNLQHFHSLAEYVNTSFKNSFQHIQWVNVTQLPSHTASALYFSQKIDNLTIDYKYVTNIESALARLKLQQLDLTNLLQLECKGGIRRFRN